MLQEVQPTIETEVSSRRHRAWAATALLWIAVVVGISLRAYWAFTLPYNDAPDEYCHYPMAVYLAEHLRPPTMADVPGTIPVSYPAMSPVGYIPSALPVLIMGSDHPFAYLAARLVSVALGGWFIVLLFSATRAFDSNRQELAVLVAWLAALQPELVFTNAYVNNDSAMLVCTAALWLWWMRLCQSPCSPDGRPWLIVGALSGLTVLTKANGAGVIAAGAPLAVFMALQSWRFGHPLRTVRPWLVATLTALAVCFPWCLWNYLQHRSMFGLDVHDQWWRQHVLDSGIRQGYLTLNLLGAFVTKSWETWWAAFGYVSVRLDPWYYLMATLLVGIAVGALMVPTHMTKHATSGSTLKLAVLGFALVAVLCAHVYHSAMFGYSPQGRYLLAATWPLLLLVASGWLVIANGRSAGVLIACVPIAVFGILQAGSIRAELSSNHIHQPDRRVRARLMAHASDIPGRVAQPLPPLTFTGPARLEEAGDRTLLFTRLGGAVRWNKLVPANSVGALLVEHQAIDGDGTQDGCVRIVSAEPPGEILAEVPYRDPRIGMARYRFDLRRATEKLGARPVWIEFQPVTGDVVTILRAVALLGPDFEPWDDPRSGKLPADP